MKPGMYRDPGDLAGALLPAVVLSLVGWLAIRYMVWFFVGV